jgi:hypothetical protein
LKVTAVSNDIRKQYRHRSSYTQSVGERGARFVYSWTYSALSVIEAFTPETERTA